MGIIAYHRGRTKTFYELPLDIQGQFINEFEDPENEIFVECQNKYIPASKFTVTTSKLFQGFYAIDDSNYYKLSMAENDEYLLGLYSRQSHQN